jgi:hypothetical protein
MSNLGETCTRKLWYDLHSDHQGETLSGQTLLKFFYGDLLEALLLQLAIASGHTVEGCQDELVYMGVKGHRDAVIDGVLVDVKSASGRAFDKFKRNGLREDDPFGYLRQLTSYLAASQDDPLVVDKSGAAFLVINKESGAVCLDYYNLQDELATHEAWVSERIKLADNPFGPVRTMQDEEEGKSGNRKLGVKCSYCPYKNHCWPNLRKFLYAKGPVWLTETVVEPKVTEVIE